MKKATAQELEDAIVRLQALLTFIANAKKESA